MAYNFSDFKKKVADIETWLTGEYFSIRTGKASPQFLDTVLVESYGSRQPIKHLAAINIEDAKTLKVTPWDQSQARAIESAITQSNLGVSVSPDSSGIRVIFPMLTDERRKMLSRLVGEKLEDARVSLRKEREKIISDLQAKEKSGELSEDDKFRSRDELQKIIDEANKRFEEMANKKNGEISA